MMHGPMDVKKNRFDVLTAVNIKLTVFCEVTSHSDRQVPIFHRIISVCPKMLIPTYQITWHHIPQDHNFKYKYIYIRSVCMKNLVPEKQSS